MYNFIDEIVTKFEENQENFMFETIYPFCKEVIQREISKEELTNALLFWRAITKEHKTNGDMIKAMFPNLQLYSNFSYWNVNLSDTYISVDKKWWRSPYKMESEGKE